MSDPEFDLGPGGQPGKMSPVIRRHPQTGERHQDWLQWGLLSHGTLDPATAPRPIHARAETVLEVPAFADAFRRRRALVAVDTYYQRRTIGGAGRFAISRRDGQPMGLAALWESYVEPDGAVLRTFCLLTIAAAAPVADIHDRMPVVIEPDDFGLWLGDEEGDTVALLRPSAAGVLQCKPISRR